MTRDRVFAVSLVISTVFHLSMVTLFSIVLMFERRELPYIEVAFRQEFPEPVEVATPDRTSGDSLQLRDPGDLLDSVIAGNADKHSPFTDGTLKLSAPSLTAGGRPAIELPKLEFAELERLRLRQEVLPLNDDLERYLEPRARDPWARFGRGLGELSDALLRFGDRRTTVEQTKPKPAPVSRPAPGFAAYIEWMSEPYDRIVLATPPVQALWGRDPAQLTEPISLIFTVNSEGRVIEVLNPVDDDLVTSVGIALSKYRFAPLLDAQVLQNQRGAFRIVAEPAE